MMTIYNRAITDNDMAEIASYMNDKIREQVHSELAPCTHGEFIARYLELDEEFIDILESEFDFEADVPMYSVVDVPADERHYDEFYMGQYDDLEEAKKNARFFSSRAGKGYRTILVNTLDYQAGNYDEMTYEEAYEEI